MHLYPLPNLIIQAAKSTHLFISRALPLPFLPYCFHCQKFKELIFFAPSPIAFNNYQQLSLNGRNSKKRKSWRENVRKEDYVWQVPMMREEATQLQEVQCDLLDWHIHLPSSARYHDCKFVQTPRQEPINLPKGRLWRTSQLWFVVTKFWAPADLICQNLLRFGRKVWH